MRAGATYWREMLVVFCNLYMYDLVQNVAKDRDKYEDMNGTEFTTEEEMKESIALIGPRYLLKA